MAAYPISWKGKAKATNHDFDLDPTVTYRQLHSSNLGVRDPLRVVALCDSDAFYAACEMVRLGVDKEQPLVVLQWNALIAVNYPARKYGISRMDKLQDALKRCPHLKVVHVATYKEGEKEPGYWDDVDTKTHKVSLDFYRRESTKMQSLFKELLPDVEIEKASIDEAFFDFTKLAKTKLLERFPYLASVPHDAPRGADSPLPPPPPLSWEGLGTVIPVHPVAPPSDKRKGEGEGEGKQAEGEGESKDDSPDMEDDAPNLEDDSTTWHDHALAIAAEYMLKAKEEIYTRLGYTTSAGIGRNKFLAKLTASYRKPRGLNVLRNAAIPNYLRPLPFQRIRFLGGKLGKAIAQEYDASTVGDLLTIPLEEMQQKFGEESIWVYEVLRGIDRNEVKEKTALFKSMLASKNLPKPITNAADGHQWLRVLAAELALRLKDARLESPNLWPKTLVLHARKGYDAGRSKQIPFPFTNEATVDYIARLADKLWTELVGTATVLNVSSVQLGFTGLGNSEAGQQSISGFFSNAKPASGGKSASRGKPTSRSNPSSSSARAGSRPGSSNARQGSSNAKQGRSDAKPGSSSRAQIVGPSSPATGKRPREALDEPPNVGEPPEGGAPSEVVDVDGTLNSDDGTLSSDAAFRCARCRKDIALPYRPDDADDRASALAALRLEHDDFHFAQDLARSERVTPTPVAPIRPSKKRKKGGKAEGIEKFFARK